MKEPKELNISYLDIISSTGMITERTEKEINQQAKLTGSEYTSLKPCLIDQDFLSQAIPSQRIFYKPAPLIDIPKLGTYHYQELIKDPEPDTEEGSDFNQAYKKGDVIIHKPRTRKQTMFYKP